MTGPEYREALKRMRLTINGASRFLKVARRTGQMYADNGPPPTVAVLINILERMSEREREHWIAPHR